MQRLVLKSCLRSVCRKCTIRSIVSLRVLTSTTLTFVFHPRRPTGVDAPTVDNTVGADRLLVLWSPPRRQNGRLSFYEVLIARNASVATPSIAYRGRETSFTATGLTPDTAYRVLIRVYNVDVSGFAESPTVVATTPLNIPEQLQPPRVRVVGAREVEVFVLPPAQPNGVIHYYGVLINDVMVRNVTSPGNYSVTGLIPYTTFRVAVRVCIRATPTSASGCATSDSTAATTSADIPEQQSPPTVFNLNASVVLVQWSAPGLPNGPLDYYLLQRNGVVIANVTGDTAAAELGHVDTTVSPFTTYGYSIAVHTPVGSIQSGTTNITTLPALPRGAVPPSVLVTGSMSVAVDIEPPTALNGPFVGYVLYLRLASMTSSRGTAVFSGTNSSVTLDRSGLLLPFTHYEIRSVVINTVGRANRYC